VFVEFELFEFVCFTGGHGPDPNNQVIELAERSCNRFVYLVWMYLPQRDLALRLPQGIHTAALVKISIRYTVRANGYESQPTMECVKVRMGPLISFYTVLVLIRQEPLRTLQSGLNIMSSI
jgi:hypothetical protein